MEVSLRTASLLEPLPFTFPGATSHRNVLICSAVSEMVRPGPTGGGGTMGKRGVGATLHNVADGGDLAEGNDTRQRELHGGEHADGRAKERG